MKIVIIIITKIDDHNKSILIIDYNHTVHVYKEKLLIDIFSYFPCLCVSMLFDSLVEIKD